MTRLQLVDDAYRANDRHSIRVSTSDLVELEGVARRILAPAITAIDELTAALARRDTDGVVAAERRLVAVCELARISANRLERTLR